MTDQTSKTAKTKNFPVSINQQETLNETRLIQAQTPQLASHRRT